MTDLMMSKMCVSLKTLNRLLHTEGCHELGSIIILTVQFLSC